MKPSPWPVFQRRDPKPGRGPETLSSQPKGYPFKVKAALRSGRSPVFGGRAIGADAPNHSAVMSVNTSRKAVGSHYLHFLFLSDPDRPPVSLIPTMFSPLASILCPPKPVAHSHAGAPTSRSLRSKIQNAL
jgi:hypothetical protein